MRPPERQRGRWQRIAPAKVWLPTVIIAQKDMDALLAAQNFQNSDRSSPDAAARIGKLIGAQEIVLVDLISAIQSSHQENKTIATVEAEAGARVVDVESGVALSQFTSNYKGNEVAGEIKRWPVLKQPAESCWEPGPKMWTKATDSQTNDLAANELAIEQGTKMGRRSIMRIRVNLEPELSGTGIVVLRGVLRL